MHGLVIFKVCTHCEKMCFYWNEPQYVLNAKKRRFLFAEELIIMYL
jgi:hypothetical protein